MFAFAVIVLALVAMTVNATDEPKYGNLRIPTALAKFLPDFTWPWQKSSPPPPPPTLSSSSGSTSSGASSRPVYCPSTRDLQIVYGSSNIVKQGWSTTGGGGVSTKASFNLLGGTVEYDVDFSKTKIGVNANVYTISPSFKSASFSNTWDYCDGQKTGSKWCVEIDWIETNGACGGATALHTVPGTGYGCTAWGCAGHFLYNTKSSFKMRIDTDLNGVVTVRRDGQIVSINQNGSPSAASWAAVKAAYQSKGAVIYSSQWVGWVPDVGKKCAAAKGDLSSSTYSVSNLRITGAVVQGPAPTLC